MPESPPIFSSTHTYLRLRPLLLLCVAGVVDENKRLKLEVLADLVAWEHALQQGKQDLRGQDYKYMQYYTLHSKNNVVCSYKNKTIHTPT